MIGNSCFLLFYILLGKYGNIYGMHVSTLLPVPMTDISNWLCWPVQLKWHNLRILLYRDSNLLPLIKRSWQTRYSMDVLRPIRRVGGQSPTLGTQYDWLRYIRLGFLFVCFCFFLLNLGEENPDTTHCNSKLLPNQSSTWMQSKGRTWSI